MKVEELFDMACEACNCDDPNCGLILKPKCHPAAGTHVKFFKTPGGLQVECAVCGELVAQLEVTKPRAGDSITPPAGEGHADPAERN